MRTREEDLPEVRRQSRPAAAAPLAPARTGGANSRTSGPDAPARGGGLGRAAGPEGASDAPAQSGRGAAALGRAPERASGPEVFSKFLKEDPWSTDDPWRAGAGAQGPAGRGTAHGRQSGGGARGPYGGNGRREDGGKGFGDWSHFKSTFSSPALDGGARGPQGAERGAHGPQGAQGTGTRAVPPVEATGALTPEPTRRRESDASPFGDRG